ncbi:MAG: hypothetical protein LC774_04620, partial [Acidobacteria bacterium]|nr:hypothetical protein [Acidobacteriota bacterium]
METADHAARSRPPLTATACAECLEAVSKPVVNLRGEALCSACAADYYAPCAACGGLVPRDEALDRDGASRCPACDLKAANVAPEDVPEEAEVDELIAEYVALHAEEKRVKDRMEEIKERLKIAASVRQRVANAVTLRGEGGAIKCSYRPVWKCDEEKVAALEGALDAGRFAALFQRSVKYAPVKE